MAEPLGTPAPRDRALSILRQHGWNTTSFQLLEPQCAYFFDGDDAFVGYFDTGTAWVAGGAPVAAPERLTEVASRFVAAARRVGRRACFFSAAHRFVEASGWHSVPVGEQPTWNPARWPEVLGAVASLRAQVRRARAHGVRVRTLGACEIAEGTPTRRALDALVAAWQRQKPMAPMGFLVDLAPFDHPGERINFVAERDGAIVAFLSAVPIYARNGWLVEDLLRARAAPNGTTELLVDAAMRETAARGAEVITLGMAPLGGDVPRGLAWVRDHARPLYDFGGVRAFKAKLRPHAWEPLYLAVPPGGSMWVAMVESLRAFARGSFVGFGLRTFVRGPPLVIGALAAALVAWIPVLVLADSGRWFPAPWVQSAWVFFDIVLGVLLLSLARRYRPGLASLTTGLVALDATLTLVEALAWNLPRIRGSVDVLVIAIACAGPALGALALRGMIRSQPEASRPPPGSLRAAS